MVCMERKHDFQVQMIHQIVTIFKEMKQNNVDLQAVQSHTCAHMQHAHVGCCQQCADDETVAALSCTIQRQELNAMFEASA